MADSTDPYDWWRRALVDPAHLKTAHDGVPHCGFYKRRLEKDRPFVPAAIWRAGDGTWRCRVGYEDLFQMRDAVAEWTWMCRHPVSKAAYLHAHAFHVWPEDDEVPRFLGRVETGLTAPDPDAGELSYYRDQIDSFRKRAKAPFLESGRAVDNTFANLRERIDDALRLLALAEDPVSQ